MNTDIFSYKQPLFKPCDQEFPQFIELEASNVTIPISYTILDLLNNYGFSDRNNNTLQSLLDEIVKSPSYFFPEVSLLFDRSNWLSSFVPDDNSYYKLNWNSLILQVHISILNKIGFKKIADTLKPHAKSPSFDFSSQMGIQSYRPSNLALHDQDLNIEIVNEHHAPKFMKHDKSTGSFKLNQNRCIGSFNAPKKPSIKKSLEPLQSLSVLPIQREVTKVTTEISQDVSLEIHPFLSIQFNCSLDSPFFKSLVLSVIAHGYLDITFGCLIAYEYSKNIKEVGIPISDVTDPSSVFNKYYDNVVRCLMDQNIEMVNLLISSKNIEINAYALYCIREIDYSEKNNVICKLERILLNKFNKIKILNL